MSLKLHHQNLVSGSSSSSLVAVKPIKTYLFNRRVVGLDHLLFNRRYTRKKSRVRLSLPESSELSFICRLPQFRKQSVCRLTRTDHLLPRASADDSMTVNGSPQARTGSNVEEMRFKLNQSLQGEDYNTGLVQSLHDSARVFELAIKQQKSFSKISWFSTLWLGVDKAAWVKALSYQASVYSLLQAASEISSRGDGRDRDVNIFVRKSLSWQYSPLENIIKEKLLAKLPEAYEWFWSEQIPVAVTNFVDYFEKDQRFTATETFRKGLSSVSRSPSDISLLMLALSCIAAITKLGPAKVSCAPFFSIILDITGRLMDMLVEIVPIRQAYHSIKETGLRRQFLVYFGPRAAACRIKNDLGTEEIMFWVGLIQKQLWRAIDREKIWSRITTCESIEVLEKDLAIFGFFIALGRSTQFYLSVNGFDTVDEPIKGFIRYLIGGSVPYYPQLSSISAYQLYVEVVCEELDWLPFYPGCSSISKRTPWHKNTEGPPNTEAIRLVLDVCSYWIQSFIKYSKWLENPSNVKAARFLSKGHDKLKMCMQELGIKKTGSGNYLPLKKELDSFDKALGSVEEALLRLEDLLQELHVKSSNSGKEHIKAACSDLERIRRLKKEAEFLEASFRAKAASLQQGDDVSSSTSPISEQHQYSRGQGSKSATMKMDRSSRVSNPHGLWNILAYRPGKSSDTGSSTAIENDGGYHEQEIVSKEIVDLESNEIQRFELLRSELIELEKLVQKSTGQYEYDEEEIQTRDDALRYSNEAKGAQLVQVQKKESVIEKSLDKLKETSTDVWQGTQLLAIDTSAAMGLLRRVLIGDELTEKEKQSLQRTLTDLASVVPIGFLMLLPVTAVGHAAMLAAIQRYVPSLIPSTYGPERLDLLRQLEKVKEMVDKVNPSESPEQ